MAPPVLPAAHPGLDISGVTMHILISAVILAVALVTLVEIAMYFFRKTKAAAVTVATDVKTAVETVETDAKTVVTDAEKDVAKL